MYHRLVLFRYHQNMTLVTKLMLSLIADMTKPFGILDVREHIRGSDCGKLLAFVEEQVQQTLNDITETLIAMKIPSVPIQGAMLPLILEQARDVEQSLPCTICVPYQYDPWLASLISAGDIGGEVLARRSRLCKQLPCQNPLDQPLHHAKGLLPYAEACERFSEEVSATFHKLEMHDAAVVCKEFKFLPSESSLLQNCLGRTSWHIYLDQASPSLTSVVEMVEQMKRFDAGEVNTKDLLGRSPLHIACIKNWAFAVQVLIGLGADPATVTVLGSLPLHFSAARGNVGICQYLMKSGKV